MIYNRQLLAEALAGNSIPTPGRCTGRTTAALLGAIASAISKPGVGIVVVDTSGAPNTTTARNYLAKRGGELAALLGLEQITFEVGYHHVTCTNNWTVNL